MESRGLPGKVKAWCGKCYMTFENGKRSQMVQEHVNLQDCDAYACDKPVKYRCIRRFRSTNSANRHMYCYSEEQVKDWEEGIKVSKPNIEELMMGTLVLSDGHKGCEAREKRECQAEKTEGSGYEIEDEATLSQVMERVKTVLGKEHPRKALARVKQAYKRSGFTSALAFRIARLNEGSWEFLSRDFVKTCPEVTGISQVLKHLLCRPF